eukprot:g1191.t1
MGNILSTPTNCGLSVVALDLLMKVRMTLFRGNAIQAVGNPRTAQMLEAVPNSAYWSVAQLNHAEYTAPLALLMFYLSSKYEDKPGELTKWGERWSK